MLEDEPLKRDGRDEDKDDADDPSSMESPEKRVTRLSCVDETMDPRESSLEPCVDEGDGGVEDADGIEGGEGAGSDEADALAGLRGKGVSREEAKDCGSEDESRRAILITMVEVLNDIPPLFDESCGRLFKGRGWVAEVVGADA